MDYQYQINNDKTASLSLTVSQNIVIDVMYCDSDNVYRVNENQFNRAIKITNVNYVQRYFTSTEFSLLLVKVKSYTPQTV